MNAEKIIEELEKYESDEFTHVHVTKLESPTKRAAKYNGMTFYVEYDHNMFLLDGGKSDIVNVINEKFFDNYVYDHDVMYYKAVYKLFFEEDDIDSYVDFITRCSVLQKQFTINLYISILAKIIYNNGYKEEKLLKRLRSNYYVYDTKFNNNHDNDYYEFAIQWIKDAIKVIHDNGSFEQWVNEIAEACALCMPLPFSFTTYKMIWPHKLETLDDDGTKLIAIRYAGLPCPLER